MLKKIGIRNSLIYLIIVVAIFFAFGFKIPVKTERVEKTVYEDKVYFKGIYFGNEDVIYKGALESIKNLKIPDGEKIAKDTKIADNIQSKSPGILIYSVDGYENKYTIDNVKSLNLSEMDKIIENQSITPGLKTLDNGNLYIYAYVGKDGSFKKKQECRVLMGSTLTDAKVEDVINTKEGNFIVLKLLDDINYRNLHRGMTGYIIKSRHEGIKVPSNAIIEKNGISSLFVKAPDGYVKEKKIKILYDDGESAIVSINHGEEYLKEHDDVILNPSSDIKSGVKVK